METLKNIADRLIAPPQMGATLKFNDGSTTDIISEIIATDVQSQNDTAKFAPHLRGATDYQTLSNIWHFVKQNIKYKLDSFGYQFVKRPSRTWHDKYADCKSYSIFIASLLKNLGIPFKYRFVAWNPTAEYTHVYIVVPLNGQTIIMDDVLNQFNTEKPFAKKYDYDMTKIYQLSGIGAPKAKLIDLGNKDLSQVTDGEMDLLIARDRLKTEKSIVEGMRGIGSVIAEKYQNSIDMINDAIAAVNYYQIGRVEDIDVELGLLAGQATSGQYTIDKQVCGIGDIGARAKIRQRNRVRLKNDRVKKTALLSPYQKKNIWVNKHISGSSENPTVGFLKNVAKKVKAATKKAVAVTKKVVKKGVDVNKKILKKTIDVNKKILKGTIKVTKAVTKAAIKVATLPQRLFIKGMLEVTLPKAAPFFLYLFITDPKILAKCPQKVKDKRKKAEFIANFIVNVIGMGRPHFMGIIRNGITKQYKKSPENVLAEQLKGIAGIGIVPIIMAAVKVLITLIPMIVKLFKKKPPVNVTTDDAPDDNDFKDLTEGEKTDLTKSIKEQPENTSALNTKSDNPELPITASNTDSSETNKLASNNADNDNAATKRTKGTSKQPNDNDTGTTTADQNTTTESDQPQRDSQNSTADAAANGKPMNSGGKSGWSSI